MIIRKYHVVYQEGKEFIIQKQSEWFEGPYRYNAGCNRVDELNDFGIDGKIFGLVCEKVEMWELIGK